MHNGVIFNFQRYSVHDGPGIRTTVFLKGCPLNCWWCHNPESQDIKPEIMFWERRCIRCLACVKSCGHGAISEKDGRPNFTKEKCESCGSCEKSCPAKAREAVGKIVTADFVMKEVLKDRIFFDESKGGVTFSGGEPLMQPEFLYELLDRCREEYIHTVLDTSGFASWEVLERISTKVDLFLYDIKIMDCEKHRKYTGVPNDIILENLRRLSEKRCSIFARIPIITGINDDLENIKSTGEFLSHLYIQQVNILPYHNMAMDKYNRLSKEYKLNDVTVPEDSRMSMISQTLEEYGLNVKIGG